VAKLYDQRFVQGRMSKAFGARCFQQAADYTKAAELLKEVFSYPDPPKMLVREGLNVGVKTWPNIEPYPAKDVIAAADQAVSLLNRREKTDPGWMRIQLELARAKYERSVALKVDNSSASSNLKREASRLARPIARRRNPHSKLAAEMLSGWGISIEAAGDEPVAVVSTTPATSFDDAKEKSKALIVPLSDQLREVTAAKRKMSKMSDAAAKSDQQLEVERLQAAINQRADQSLQMLSQAVRFSNKETPRAEMNNVRYLQAYCYFAKERYADTAVVGRFLLEKYPTIEWSQQTAGLMVRGYERMYDSTTDDVRETAKRKVIDAASAMMAAWPDSKESAAAAVSAARVAVNDGDFEAAKGFFEQIPASSPTRGQLASRIGRQIWTSRKNAADDQERQEKTQRARDFLAIAAENADPATMNFSDAVANLYYIDACRETGDLDQAISRIDGLMGNLDANPAINESAEFRQSVYNASLNVYLEALRSKPDVQTWIDKSKVVIEKMSAEAVGNPAALKTVGDVFRRVASDLKAQFESLPMNDREAFATSLNSFFAGIGSVAKDGKTRLWAGSTLLGIAESLKLEGFTEKAKELSGEAIALLKSAEKAGFGKDKALERSYQVQLALAQRGSGDYSAAVSSFEKILESSNGLNIQMEAATTLLMWGIDGKDPKALTSSMNGRGDYRDPKTKKMRKRIWGWKALVGYTRGKEKLRGPFKECLYNSVRCRFEYGKIANSSKAIDSALSELNKALKRFEFLRTGGTWKNKFDQLLKDLQAAKGKAKK